MGTPWHVSPTNPNDNFTVRLKTTEDPESKEPIYTEVNLSKVGRQLEEIEYFDDQWRKARGLDPITNRFLYSNQNEDGTYEPDSDGDAWRKPYTPDAGLNSLVGHSTFVVDQYQQVAINLDKTDPDNDPLKVGFYQSIRGVNTTLSPLEQRRLGINMIFLVPNNLGQLKTVTEFPWDEDLNTLRPKMCMAFLLSDNSVKIYNLLGPIYPLATAVNDNVLSDEHNLLFHIDLRDENFDKIDSATEPATAIGDSFSFDITYVAFGDKIRRYDDRFRPQAHFGSTYELTGGGTGDITAIGFFESRIWYIQNGVVRNMTSTGGSDQAITFRTSDYDTSPRTFTNITDFDAITSYGGSLTGVIKDGVLYRCDDNLATQTDNERYEIDSADAFAQIMQNNSFMVPMRRYFNKVGEPVVSSGFRNFNLCKADSSSKIQVIGYHQTQIEDGDTIFQFQGCGFGTSGGASISASHVLDTPCDQVSRGVARIDFNGILAEVELKNKVIDLSIEYEKQWAGGRTQAAIEFDIAEWTQGGDHWPPNGNSTDFNAVGTVYHSETINALANVTADEIQFRNYAGDWLSRLASDGFLYLFFVPTNTIADLTFIHGISIDSIIVTVRGDAH